MVEYKITKPSIDAGTLLTSEGLNQLKEYAYAVMEARRTEDALLFARELETLMKGTTPSNEQQQNIASAAMFWMFKLKLFSFRRLTDQEKVSFFRQEILFYLLNQLDLVEGIGDYFAYYGDPETVLELAKNYMRLLQENNTIVSANAEFKNKGINPSVGYWFKEYQAYRISQNNLKPDRFALNSFLNNFGMVKLVAPDEKALLADLLNFFNYLLQPTVNVSKNEGRVGSFVNQQTFSIPNGGVSDVTPVQRPAAPVNIPEAPVPPKAPVTLDEVKPIPPKEEVKLAEEPKIELPRSPLQFKTPPVIKPPHSVNIQDMIRHQQEKLGNGSGITNQPKNIGDGITPKAPTPPQAPKPVNPVDIDKKLADLKKRHS